MASRLGIALRIVTLITAVGLSAAFTRDAGPANAVEPLQLDVQLADRNLKCNGDSARLTVIATRGGEPVQGLEITAIIGANSERTDLAPTNKQGRTSGRITPVAGSAAHFVYIVGTLEEGPQRYMGACPFAPDATTVSFAGNLVDHRGRAIAGEAVSLEITGPTFGSVVPPHWTRSARDGSFGWDGIPSWWSSDAFAGVPRQICLSERSRHVIARVNDVPVESPARCVSGVPLENQPVVFALERR